MGILSYLISLLMTGAFGFFLRQQVKKVDSLHEDRWLGYMPYRDCFDVSDFGLYRNTMTWDPDIPVYMEAAPRIYFRKLGYYDDDGDDDGDDYVDYNEYDYSSLWTRTY